MQTRFLLPFLLLVPALAQKAPTDRPVGQLESVATFNGPMPTGVTVSRSQPHLRQLSPLGRRGPFTVAETRQRQSRRLPQPRDQRLARTLAPQPQRLPRIKPPTRLTSSACSPSSSTPTTASGSSTPAPPSSKTSSPAAPSSSASISPPTASSKPSFSPRSRPEPTAT